VIPIVSENKIKGIILQDKLMTAIANKKLKGDDLAKKGWTIDFAKAPYNKLDCAMA